MAYDMAVMPKVCVRPLMRHVLDQETGTQEIIPIPCGSTLESVCRPCAPTHALRMQQPPEDWHLETDPYQPQMTGTPKTIKITAIKIALRDGDRIVRSTRRRQDVADLSRVDPGSQGSGLADASMHWPGGCEPAGAGLGAGATGHRRTGLGRRGGDRRADLKLLGPVGAQGLAELHPRPGCDHTV